MSRPIRIPAFPAVRQWPDGRPGKWLGSFLSLHESGRAALYWALRGLALPHGTTLWLPAYHCGVEADAAIHAGYEVRFYRIDAHLRIDEEDLRRRWEPRPGPVLLIHYFGFAQPGLDRIARFCAERGCTLIEDCAHALFSRDESGRELGSLAPVAVYSLRKTLPVVDGGAVRAAAGLPVTPRLDRFAHSAWRTYVKTAARRMMGPRLVSLYRKSRPAAPPQSPSYNAPMLSLSRTVAAAADPESIIRVRRRNYTALHQLLEQVAGYQPLWPALPEGTCPLFLPVWTSDRRAIMRQLAAAGVESFRFGASSSCRLGGSEDESEFSGITRLRDSILCLPIHQDLNLNDAYYIAQAFRRATANVGHAATYAGCELTA
jgi:perosamine synthetase